MQVAGLLFAAFAVALVAGLGWYTGERVVQGVSGRIRRGETGTISEKGGGSARGR